MERFRIVIRVSNMNQLAVTCHSQNTIIIPRLYLFNETTDMFESDICLIEPLLESVLNSYYIYLFGQSTLALTVRSLSSQYTSWFYLLYEQQHCIQRHANIAV